MSIPHKGIEGSNPSVSAIFSCKPLNLSRYSFGGSARLTKSPTKAKTLKSRPFERLAASFLSILLAQARFAHAALSRGERDRGRGARRTETRARKKADALSAIL